MLDAAGPAQATGTTECGPFDARAPPCAKYQRREPEKSILYEAVRTNWKTLLAEIAQRTDGGSLPGFVIGEFERYLGCGILANGFARVHCDSCRKDMLVAFSCKGRGICPSCTTRRMQGTAIHLVDHVIPRVPVRQWVLSLPRWARFLLARDPALITQTLDLALREIFKSHRLRAGRGGARDARPGAVTAVQRFGQTLNLNLHFHSCIPDGVFVREDGQVQFVALSAPTDDDVKAILERIVVRAQKLLRPILEAGREDARTPDALTAAQAESVASLPSSPQPATTKKLSAYREGFSLHAAVHIHANDREGLARLVGYGARPPLSQDRLTELPDGQIAIRLKRPLANGSRELRLEPVELVRRLATLVPPPRAHLSRFHGCFGPASSWRSEIVPGLPVVELKPPESAPSASTSSPEGAGTEGAPPPEPKKPRRPSARIPWADLLKRVFMLDVLACPCGGRRRMIAFITERAVIKKILDHLGLPTTGPPVEPARSAVEDFDGWQDDVPVFQQALR